MNIDKLKRLQSQVRIGGKGTPRRKKKVMHQTAAADDKKLQSSLKKLSVSTIPGIEEVNIIKDDLTVIHFNNPKAQASLSANTFAVTGHGETKKIVEMLPEILPQLGQETVVQLRMFANSMTKNQKEGVDALEPNLIGNTDDDVPLLVSDFDEIAKKEDLSKGQMQRISKAPDLNSELINASESASMQTTENNIKSEHKATTDALIEPLKIMDNSLKTEEDVKKDNTKKSEKRCDTKKPTTPGNSGTVKEGGNIKKDHSKPKNKVTDSQSSPQDQTVASLCEPLQDSGRKAKEAVKKNSTKTTEKNIEGTNIKKESSKPKLKVVGAAQNLSEKTTADPLLEALQTSGNLKIEVDTKKDNTKKSEKANTTKITDLGNTSILKDVIEKELNESQNKDIEAATSSTSQHQNEPEKNGCNKLLPTKDLNQDVIEDAEKILDVHMDMSIKTSTTLENQISTELKDDPTMISNTQTNKNQIEQTKNELVDQQNISDKISTDAFLLLADTNVAGTSDEMQQEQKDVNKLSIENTKVDFNIAVSSTASLCQTEEIVEQLKEASSSAVENTQDIHDEPVSENTLQKAIEKVTEIKETAEPSIGVSRLESQEQKLNIVRKQCETICNEVITKQAVQGVDNNLKILNLDTKIKGAPELQPELQNVVIASDSKHCLEEKKAADAQLFDSEIVSTNLPDQLQAKTVQSEDTLVKNLVDIEKQIEYVEITQDPSVSLQLVPENLLKTNEQIVVNLENIKTQPVDVDKKNDHDKKTMPEAELTKRTADESIKPQIHADSTTKSSMRGTSQKKDSPKKDSGKSQLSSSMKSDTKKPDPGARPKQVSPPKSSNTQVASPTGTTPKTQQTPKSAMGGMSIKQEKSTVAAKAKQTVSSSTKSQATANASKSSTTQPKKTSVSPPSSDPSKKNSASTKASSALETAAAVVSTKSRVDNSNQKGTKKPKPQSVPISVNKKVAEDPPKTSQ